jgi:3-phenylpropionate/trans-cinnamate dioxygenase ferredoxin subunit
LLAGLPLDFNTMRVASVTDPVRRCAWHGWEFDMRTGQSWFDPARVKAPTCPVAVEASETLAKGPYVAETFPVHVEDSYVVVEV